MDSKITLVMAYVSEDSLGLIKSFVTLDEVDLDSSTMTWYCYLELNTEEKYLSSCEFLRQHPSIANDSWLAVAKNSELSEKSRKMFEDLDVKIKKVQSSDESKI